MGIMVLNGRVSCAIVAKKAFLILFIVCAYNILQPIQKLHQDKCIDSGVM